MKILHILFIQLISISLLGQNPSDHIESKKNNQLSKFYILEEVWAPNSPKRWKTNDTPSFLQIEGQEAALHSRWRDHHRFVFGEIDGLDISDQEQGKGFDFFIRGREWSIGKLINIEIMERDNGEIIIHVFRKLGGSNGEIYFSARHASSKEKKNIIDYWNQN
jgi:hypothetical protein